MTKDEIIADSCLFQRACGKLVEAHVEQSLSQLMYSIGKDLEAAAKLFDYSYEDMFDWFMTKDWEEPAREEGWDEVDGQIVKRAGKLVGYPAHKWGNSNDFDNWDVINEAGGAFDVDERFNLGIDFDAEADDDEAIWAHLSEEQKQELIAEYVATQQDEADSWQEACEQDSIEPYEREIYEHWAVSSWLGGELSARGELVFEFCNMTIWGRGCTGQSIMLDGVICEIAKAQPDYSFIWGNE
ncbi:hypothetical protein [Ferribacterium limneticum]|uniref:hypothetical protein n=1 Tax=Ferribacterium limneticum TaxID=76259 RepID=UPI001CF823E5|nr:hypothetical protein [Ferribacterium limneticum]UCV26734.1 hypothetical protein KI617_10475 [Ferribacterium limneticum]UCV30651.1 hypothetical protein KI608_10475 [Ferribacterium limneticum]